jgi:hypothetical protein
MHLCCAAATLAVWNANPQGHRWLKAGYVRSWCMISARYGGVPQGAIRRHRWALQGTAASAQGRSPVTLLAATGQAVMGDAGAVAWVEQGATRGPAAQGHQRRLEVIKRPEAKKGFGRLPRRWGASGVTPGQPGCAAGRGRMNGWRRPRGLACCGRCDTDAHTVCRVTTSNGGGGLFAELHRQPLEIHNLSH